MGKWGNCDFSELKEFAEKMEKLSADQSREFCEAVAKELAARLLAKVIKRTPVGKAPKLASEKTKVVIGTNGKKKSFLTAEAARHEKYWGGYSGGTLRRGWTAETHEEAEAGKKDTVDVNKYVENIQVTKEGTNYVIVITNPVEYASYVEYGHIQTPGRYVPALGKRLKSCWVPGKLMMTTSEKEVGAIAPALLQKRLEQKLSEVFG